MQGECEGNATAKARGEGKGERGVKQRGRGKKPKAQKSISAKTAPYNTRPPLKSANAYLFAPFGFFSLPLCSPLSPSPSLLALSLASPCIPLHPLASPCAPLHPLASVCICSTFLGVSGCPGVGSALGVRVSDRLLGLGVGSAWLLSLSHCPCSLPKDKESKVSKTLLSFHSLYFQQLLHFVV